jgi:hypothetical protein
VLAVVVIIGGVGYEVMNHYKDHKSSANLNVTQSQTNKSNLTASSSQQKTLAAVNASATGGAGVTVTLPPANSSTSTTSTTLGTNASNGSVTGSPVKSGSPPPTSAQTYPVTGTFTVAHGGPVKSTCANGTSCGATPIADHLVEVFMNCPRTSLATTSCSGPYTTTTTNGQGQFAFAVPKDSYVLKLSPAVGSTNQSWSFTEIGLPLDLHLTVSNTAIE